MLLETAWRRGAGIRGWRAEDGDEEMGPGDEGGGGETRPAGWVLQGGDRLLA